MPVPAFPSLSALHAAYADGLSPEAVVAETYRRIAAADDPGIFLARVPEAEMQAAARALGPFDPAQKPLWGVPFAVKDNIDVADLEAILAHYENGGVSRPSKSPLMKPVSLSDGERADLIAFLRSLTADQTETALPNLPN